MADVQACGVWPTSKLAVYILANIVMSQLRSSVLYFPGSVLSSEVRATST